MFTSGITLHSQVINLIKSATGIMVMAETHGQSSGTDTTLTEEALLDLCNHHKQLPHKQTVNRAQSEGST
jgi:hypothetical protein